MILKKNVSNTTNLASTRKNTHLAVMVYGIQPLKCHISDVTSTKEDFAWKAVEMRVPLSWLHSTMISGLEQLEHWLVINEFLWHWHDGHFIGNASPLLGRDPVIPANYYKVNT